MAQQNSLIRWQQRHPNFDWKSYQRWIQTHGYYRSALDADKPEFSEYATIFLQQAKNHSQPG